MKATSIFAAIAALALSAASSLAAAAPITDTANPPSPVEVTSTHTYSHDISEHGFVIGLSSIADALLTVFLTDPTGGSEQVQIKLVDQVFNPPGGDDVIGSQDYTITLSPNSLADLQADGILDVELSVNPRNSYTFVGSTLEFNMTTTAVPEPFTLGLMAVGLAGVGVARRRKNKA